MNGDTMSTNTSRKSSIGSFSNVVKENAIRKSSIGNLSIASIADDTKEYTCRKSSIGSLSNVSLANNKEDILEGTYAKCYFLPLSVSCLMSFLTIFCENFLLNDECLVEFI